jgi:hypothetical protein
MAKAPSLRKARTRGTQRTRKLSTGKALWSWRNGKERFVRARRETAGAKPYTMKVVRTVFNGGHEETYGNATRLVPTQLECAFSHPSTHTAVGGPDGFPTSHGGAIWAYHVPQG